MSITSLDILNLSHSLKDICEVNCGTPECLNQTLKILLQYNLIRANLEFGCQFDAPQHPGGPVQEENCRFGLDISNPNRHG